MQNNYINLPFFETKLGDVYRKVSSPIPARYRSNIDNLKKEIDKYLRKLKNENNYNNLVGKNLINICKSIKGYLEQIKDVVAALAPEDHECLDDYGAAVGLLNNFFHKLLSISEKDNTDTIQKKLSEFCTNSKYKISLLNKHNTGDEKFDTVINELVGYEILAYTFFSVLKKQLKNEQISSRDVKIIARNSAGTLEKNYQCRVFRFENGEPKVTLGDVVQTRARFGDCWFLSALAGYAAKKPQCIFKCFKTIPENGMIDLSNPDPITVRLFAIKWNPIPNAPVAFILGNKKNISVKPDKFLKGVNSGRNDLPIWPRILEIAAQACMPDVDLYKEKLPGGWEGSLAAMILEGKEPKAVESLTIGPSDMNDMDGLTKKLKKIRDAITQNKVITMQLPRQKDNNTGHCVILSDYNPSNEQFLVYDEMTTRYRNYSVNELIDENMIDTGFYILG